MRREAESSLVVLRGVAGSDLDSESGLVKLIRSDHPASPMLFLHKIGRIYRHLADLPMNTFAYHPTYTGWNLKRSLYKVPVVCRAQWGRRVVRIWRGQTTAAWTSVHYIVIPVHCVDYLFKRVWNGFIFIWCSLSSVHQHIASFHKTT